MAEEKNKPKKKLFIKPIICTLIVIAIMFVLLFPIPYQPQPKNLPTPKRPPIKPKPPTPSSTVEAEALKILEANGTEAAFNYALKTGLIKEPLPPIPANSTLYKSLIKTYGKKLENYPSIVGRVQLLKAMGIDARDP